MKDKPFTWSPSALKSFGTCPRQYHFKYWNPNTMREPDSEAMIWGKDVHTAFEHAVLYDNPILPARFKVYQKWLDAVRSLPGNKYPEQKVAFNRFWEEVEFFAPDAWLRLIVDLTVQEWDEEGPIKAVILDYKGLPVDTLLPTPRGWTTMGEVQVGDQVFNGKGEACKVEGKSQVKILPCYKITFTNGSSVTCDEEHLWRLYDGSVVTTPELNITRGKGHPASKIPIAEAVHYRGSEMPIDPYLLGLWLADGKHTSSEITKPDQEIWDEIQRRGYDISHDYSAKAENGKCRVHTVYSIRPLLKQLGVLGNKHIPSQYMMGARSQRIDLLRGIMDGDGSYNKTRNQAVLNTVDESFATQVLELVRSLGQNAYLSPHIAYGFGLTVQAYYVSWRPRVFNPFLLPRKADLVDLTKTGHSAWLKIKSIELLPAQPTQCIKVDSEDSTYLCTENYIVTHNTGKSRYDNDDQLKLSSIQSLSHPTIETFHAGYIYLKEDHSTYVGNTREGVENYKQEFEIKVEPMAEAVATCTFKPKPSGLCKKWCSDLACPHNGKS